MALHTRYLRRAAVKRPVLTRNSGPACMRVYPQCTGAMVVHTRGGGEEGRGGSFRGSQPSVVTESDVRRSAARAERRVIYGAISLVCRCRDCEGCPPISPFLRGPDYPPSPSPSAVPRRERRTPLIVAHGPTAQLRRARSFIRLAPAILQPIMD